MIFIGILAAVLVVFAVLKWWTDGLISGTEALVLSVIYGGMIIGLFAARGTSAQLLIALPLLISAVWAAHQFKMDGARQYYRDKIKTYQQAIQADPANCAARSAMAEAYYCLGDLDSAIAAMEVAVESTPNNIKESYRLRQWQDERELRDSRTITCVNCHTVNVWGETLCRTCRLPIAYPIKGGANGKAGTFPAKHAAVVGGWLILTILAFVRLAALQAAVVAGCAALGCAGWMLLASSKKQEIK